MDPAPSDLEVVDAVLLAVDTAYGALRRAATAAQDIVETTNNALGVLDEARELADDALEQGRESRAFEDGTDGLRRLRVRAAAVSADASEVEHATNRAREAVEFATTQVATMSDTDEAKALTRHLHALSEVLEVVRPVASDVRENAEIVVNNVVRADDPPQLSRAITTGVAHMNRVQGSTVAMRAALKSTQRGVAGASNAGVELKHAALAPNAPASGGASPGR